MRSKGFVFRVADFAVSFLAVLMALGLVQGILYLISQSSILDFGYSLGLITGNTLIWGLSRPISKSW